MLINFSENTWLDADQFALRGRAWLIAGIKKPREYRALEVVYFSYRVVQAAFLASLALFSAVLAKASSHEAFSLFNSALSRAYSISVFIMQLLPSREFQQILANVPCYLLAV